ncbi:MAG: hypothetical protein KatS3mg018_1067 [Fimbriimonadales bacterium]|nr:MAG: hypothetical protein KatS3mg018_1067 [Fimbriimonadales bacterium]
MLKLQLDEGEAEAIALALQERTEVVLLDDSQARLMARRLNLQVTGVVGILIRAKREAKIVSLKQEIDRLREQGGFWLAERVVQRALQAVGENDQI